MSDETPPSSRKLWLVTLVAVAAAAAPHFFFAPPLQLHMEGQMQAWLGIAVWAPAILAGVAFFFGVEFGSHDDTRARSFEDTTRAALVMCALVGFFVLAASLNPSRWTNMVSMRPWGELQTMLPLFGGLGALRAVFWQGFVQHVTLAKAPTGQRAAVLLALEVAVVVGFFVSAEPATIASALLPLVVGEACVGALSYELGYRVRTTMLLRALCGVAFVWFQQAMLL